MVASTSIAEKMRAFLPPWTVGSMAQAVGERLIDDDDFDRRVIPEVWKLRVNLQSQLSSISGLHVYPSVANYLFARIDRKDFDAPKIAGLLVNEGIAIRVCENYKGLDRRFFRVAVRSSQENELLIHALQKVLNEKTPHVLRTRKTPALMFQGTSSNAGKSVMTAALCRILLQDGVRVAPFKAQNMSLNSYVTLDGGEMGRAQVVQAQACRLDPDVLMNPVLLKPNSDCGSQVIVKGKAVGNMNVDQYIRYKPEVVTHVRECYDDLSSNFDAVVLEGAGSPGEVNLKHHDIVNMTMARYANAPVLLVGDIDRGGVFASFVGTMEVLDEWERKLVAGFLVNRFRGDASLLQPAFDYMMEHTGKPVVGTVPYISSLGLEEEDSVSLKENGFGLKPGRDDVIDIAVCDLPHISNFTDFDALVIEPDVHVRLVKKPEELGIPDAVILPGSKSVITDMAYLTNSGMAACLKNLADKNESKIVGICGGFQMLGRIIEDPSGIESSVKTMRGLRLLDLHTTLAKEKTLTRSKGTHAGSMHSVFGYEIHHGQSNGQNLKHVIVDSNNQPLGLGLDDESIWGTYLHGLFDADEFRRGFIDSLREKKGWAKLVKVQAVYDTESALDRLADTVRANLDMNFIYKVMGL
jgi:cobyric acid synthase CobQ